MNRSQDSTQTKEKNLEFLFQDETRDGKTSRFWKFVTQEVKK